LATSSTNKSCLNFPSILDISTKKKETNSYLQVWKTIGCIFYCGVSSKLLYRYLKLYSIIYIKKGKSLLTSNIYQNKQTNLRLILKQQMTKLKRFSWLRKLWIKKKFSHKMKIILSIKRGNLRRSGCSKKSLTNKNFSISFVHRYIQGVKLRKYTKPVWTRALFTKNTVTLLTKK
jgi:hypothetical protein